MDKRSVALDIFLFLTANGIDTKLSDDNPPRFAYRDRAKVLTPEMRHAINKHSHELVALLTATRIDKEAACPVSPSGQHQWYELTGGGRKCLSCLVPMPTPVAANDVHAAVDAA